MVVGVPEDEGGHVADHAAVEEPPELRVRLGAHQPDVQSRDDEGGQTVDGLWRTDSDVRCRMSRAVMMRVVRP